VQIGRHSGSNDHNWRILQRARPSVRAEPIIASISAKRIQTRPRRPAALAISAEKGGKA
jgi:hypothetical protein